MTAISSTTRPARGLYADALPAIAFDWSAAISEWRRQNRIARNFGFICRATLPPMDRPTMDRLSEETIGLYYRGILSREEVRDEQAAMWAANAEHRGRGKGRSSAEIRRLLIERDGEGCWLCGEDLGDDCTIEHKVSKSRGGTWAFGNLALTHAACNRLLGNAPLSVKEAARSSDFIEHSREARRG